MDGKISSAKLIRTHSSLLRSSSNLRSSLHSLSSLAEEDSIKPDIETGDKQRRTPRNRSGSISRIGSTRFNPVFAMGFLSIFALSSLFFFYFHLTKNEIPTSENFLLALTLIAIALFLASKNKAIINQTLKTIKYIFLPKKPSEPVQWFIGESKESKPKFRNPQKENHIEGVEVYSTGDFYEGEFRKGKCNGSGVYTYFVNGRYEGDWVDGRYDGYGIESWARGSRYKGQYRQGSRHGFGVYRFYTGDCYAGQWCNGQSSGVGSQTCADGSCYVGEFKSGVKHGLGCYHFRNGDKYAGEYFGDKIHGFGIYHFANGHRYEGSWHEGRKQGYGMYTFRNGDRKCGEWNSGHLSTPLSHLSTAVLGAVQASRKRAEDASGVCRVEEQVNRAVSAANRAATAARVAAVKAVQNQIDDSRFCESKP